VTYVYVIAGAIAGAPLRYFVGSRVQGLADGTFPWGTFAVNISGCFLIGLLLGLAEQRDLLGREARLLLVTGFLGSYTTFSAFGWETYELARGDEVFRAVANAAASVVLGVLAAWAGASLARAA
jgi:CrcB protein